MVAAPLPEDAGADDAKPVADEGDSCFCLLWKTICSRFCFDYFLVLKIRSVQNRFGFGFVGVGVYTASNDDDSWPSCFRAKLPALPPASPIKPISQNSHRKKQRLETTPVKQGTQPPSAKRKAPSDTPRPRGEIAKVDTPLKQAPKNLYSRAYHATLKSQLAAGVPEARAKGEARAAGAAARDSAA